MKDEKIASSSLMLDSRERLSVTGVRDVINFNDEAIILETELGMLTVKGANFKINKLSIDVGELLIDGIIDSIYYSDSAVPRDGFFARIFK